MAPNKNGRVKKNRKLVIVGDGMCGKTCLLMAFKDDQFIPNHDATIFDTYVATIEVGRKTIELALFDTAGQEDYERLRALSYPDANIVLICFSVDNPASAANVVKIWMPEVREFCDPCPVILVACKKDLRTDPQIIAELEKIGEKPLTTEVGKQIANHIKADAYMECSAKTREGVQDLFIHAAYLTLKKRFRRPPTTHCVLF